MISLSLLNKLQKTIIIFLFLIFNSATAQAADEIWKSNEAQNTQELDKKKITIESPILSEDVTKISISIDEQSLKKSDSSVIGLFDPEENNFNLNMWEQTNGKDIITTFNRINKLKLSKFSENLLFQVLFTNAYPPKKNLSADDFLKIKINWLIKNRRYEDLENLLLINPEAGKNSKAIEILVNESLSNADIKSACKKMSILDKQIQNDYLEKFKIYCLINDKRIAEAQLVYDLLKERGFKDNFFEDKMNFLFGFTETTNKKILDDNLFNFYLSHITSKNFDYQPSDRTDKYIWRYLSSSNLIKIDNLENDEILLTYEKAAAEDSFNRQDIFNIYKSILFNVNQLINATEVYKNLSKHKARALIYQSILLSNDIERKLYLAFLLKDLFAKDKLSSVYSEEFLNILKNIDQNKIPDNYSELVEQNLKESYLDIRKIKFDNDILHRSKVLKHFLDDEAKPNRTKKDFKNVYKKIKKNKKYFISIKDIIVIESLEVDGVDLPEDLNYGEFSSELTIPDNLQALVKENQMGLVMLKIIEIIGEDDIRDLDPETIYFLNRILNELNLKKIRNNILSEVLPLRA